MKLPGEVRQILRRREWDNSTHFKERLAGVRSEPMVVRLDAPTGPQALAAMPEYVAFVDQWRQVSVQHPGLVQFERRNLQVLKDQEIPVQITILDLQALARFIDEPVAPVDEIYRRLDLLSDHGDRVRSAAARNFRAIEGLSVEDLDMLDRALNGLIPGLGQGFHLRSLNLPGVHTKFVENNVPLLERLADAKFDGAVTTQGGLLRWLGCTERGADQLLVRPLCPATRQAFAGASHFWIESDVLRQVVMPGRGIVIFENTLYRYPLPEIDGVVAICGAGNNLQWLDSPWLRDRPVAYSGDLDTWGIRIFAQVRMALPHVIPLLMNLETLAANEECVVTEPEPCTIDHSSLPGELQLLYTGLQSHPKGPARLEHDKLRPETFTDALNGWTESQFGYRGV